MVRKFDTIRPILAEIDESLTGKGFAGVVGSFLQFMEEILGRDAPQPRVAVKLPYRLFADFSPNGSLCTVLRKMVQIRDQMGARRFDFGNPTRREKNVELLLELTHHLKESGLIPQHRLFFSQFVDDELRTAVSKIAHDMGALVVPNEASATHILFPPTFCDEGDDDEYLRCLQRSSDRKRCLVHWWYYPDSYDHWVPATDVEGDPEPVDGTRPQWRVSTSWVKHSYNFNEWMNELDYEVLEETVQHVLNMQQAPQQTAQDKKKAESKKRTKEPRTPKSEEPEPKRPRLVKSKRSDTDDSKPPTPERELLPKTENSETNRLLTQQRQFQPQSPVIEPLDNVPPEQTLGKDRLSIINISQVPQSETGVLSVPGQPNLAASIQSNFGVSQATAATTNSAEVSQPSALPTAPAVLLRSTREAAVNTEAAVKLIVEAGHTTPKYIQALIPSYSAWFSLDDIHPIERRSLPEFFETRSTSRTAKQYKEMRNFMVQEWRKAPDEYLTLTQVRRHLAADVGVLFRVHLFLEHWGLINFNTQTLIRPPVPQNSSDKPVKAEPNSSRGSQMSGERMVVETGSGSKLSSLPTPPHLRTGFIRLVDAHETSQEWIKGRARLLARGEVRVYCNQCRRDCSMVHYVSSKVPFVTVCPTCFGCGQYGTGLFHEDFTKMVQDEGMRDTTHEWTEDEELLLLEALEQYQDRWMDVAAVVGKTAEQCIAHFCRMPIIDKFLVGHQEAKTIRTGWAKDQDGVWDESCFNPDAPLPFSNTPNPLLSQIGFMASFISPEVASAASEAAIGSIQTGKLPDSDAPIPFGQFDLQKATVAALAAAAKEARKISDAEAAEVQRLAACAIETQVQKLEYKLKHFKELEDLLATETKKCEDVRLKLYQQKELLRAQEQSLQQRWAELRTAQQGASENPLLNPEM
eukprot:c20683_g1_i1.p1 GENE.c20683_g1_i1~~c20683_g1_i1.p1  ORF type:complete len:944 (-),score=214.78 c20683_g1_i1:80-2833(-)